MGFSMTKKEHNCLGCDFKRGLCSGCKSSNEECSIDENTGLLVCDKCLR